MIGFIPTYKTLRKAKFALTHNWTLFLPTDILSALFTLFPANTAIQGLAAAISPNMRCTSVTPIPHTNVKTETVRIHGLQTTQIVSADQTDTITLTMYEDDLHINYRLFTIWRDLGMSPKSYAHMHRRYISLPRGVFLWLDTPGRQIPSLSFELFDVQPTEVKLSDMNNDPQFQTCTVTLKYSNYETL